METIEMTVTLVVRIGRDEGERTLESVRDAVQDSLGAVNKRLERTDEEQNHIDVVDCIDCARCPMPKREMRR